LIVYGLDSRLLSGKSYTYLISIETFEKPGDFQNSTLFTINHKVHKARTTPEAKYCMSGV